MGQEALPVDGERTKVSVLERLVVYPILYPFYGAGYADTARVEQLLRGTHHRRRHILIFVNPIHR